MKLNNKNLRPNITKIRTTSHCLPIEQLRKKGIPRDRRFCTLCNNFIDSEYHVLMLCNHVIQKKLCKDFNEKILEING